MPAAFISHPKCAAHDMGETHPEQPARLSAVEDALRVGGRFDSLSHHEAPQATVEQLARAHERAYIDQLQALAPAEGMVQIDPDTRMCPDTWEAALRSAGAAVLATDLVMQDEAKRVFCNVRPPGHHAERAQSMGFCLFNNVAVGALHALEAHGLERVAIVDFDVHFGNGTAEILTGDERILMCQTYEHPLYPGMNPPSIPGHIVNCPLSPGSTGEEFRATIKSDWLPALDAFAPQLLFISAGFDAAVGDPLASLRLTADDYAWVTAELREIANLHAEGRLISTLEGGYNLDELANCACAHITALMNSG
jgi:acetoin utilization deacetylase AcuC-like enzyme